MPSSLNRVRQSSGVVCNARQEGRTHFREPWQAEEVDAGNWSNPAIVLRPARGIQYREIDPAIVELVSSRPDDGAEAGTPHVDLAQRFTDLRRILTSCSGFGVSRNIHAAPRDKSVNPFQKIAVGCIAIVKASAKVTGKMQNAIAERLQSSEQRNSLRGEFAEVDRVPAIGSGD